MNRRIVITGMGAVSTLGCGVEIIWSRLLAGQSGIRSLPKEIGAQLPVKIGGSVPDSIADPLAGFNPESVVALKDQKKMDRFILFALAAAEEALRQSGWIAAGQRQQERTATIIATGIGGFPAIANAVLAGDPGGYRRSPFLHFWQIWRQARCRLTTALKVR